MSTSSSAEIIRRKVSRRLLPTLFAMFVLSFLDRTNVALVKEHLAVDLGIGAAAYGFGAGVFFLAYAVLGVPSNLVLHRVGARRWLALIMLAWGLLSCAMALVTGPTSFYVLRLLLGAAEAGFFPGVILYITYWFPERDRGRATGLFQSAVAVASIIGNPLGGFLLGMHGIGGLDGWQWMFLLEGLPAALLALAVPWLLTDHPAQAKWLTSDERAELISRIEADEPPPSATPPRSTAVLRDTRVLRLMLIYFAIQIGVYGVTFWLPALVRRIGGLDDLSTGFISALPWFFALAGVLLLPRWSDRSGRRRAPLAVAMAMTVIGLVGAVVLPPVAAVGSLCVAAFGFLGAQPVFWTVPPTFLAGARGAGTIALISGFGNVGGFVGPYVMGLTESTTGSGTAGLYGIAAVVAIGIAAAVSLRWLRDGRAGHERSAATSAQGTPDSER